YYIMMAIIMAVEVIYSANLRYSSKYCAWSEAAFRPLIRPVNVTTETMWTKSSIIEIVFLVVL
ncbi:MAG: hypothetical protein QXF36_00560, partial [Candidatus Caldarchaeum sp.]